MSGLDLFTLGVGNAFSARHYSTCLALRAEGRWLLVDCPHPIRKIMREGALRAGLQGLDLDEVEAVALTHLHADHASGLEGFGFYAHFVLRRRARVAAHPAVSARLWGGHLAAGMEAPRNSPDGPRLARCDDYFEVLALDDAAPVQVGPFQIACRLTRHPIPTTALRIQAGGRTLSYSADTELDPDLIAWLAPADLVVHETGPGIHAPLEGLAQLPAELRRRMRLVHYPDELDLSASPVEPLEQGRRYAI